MISAERTLVLAETANGAAGVALIRKVAVAEPKPMTLSEDGLTAPRTSGTT